jgi:hypothetical protein
MPGRARAAVIRLSGKRRRKLEQVIRAGTSPQRLVLRAKIVLAAASGASNTATGREVGCSAATARTWRARFACRGIPGLFDKPRSGRPETRAQRPAGGRGHRHRRPARRRVTVVPLRGSPPTWASGACPSRRPPPAGCWPRRRSARTGSAAGPTAPATPRSGPGPGGCAACTWTRRRAPCGVSVDEKTGIQAKSRKHPQIPARPGRDARRELEYIRHGTISIIAAMNVTTGQVIAERISRSNSATFTAFLSMLHQMVPRHLSIHLICDNSSSHTSAATPLAAA